MVLAGAILLSTLILAGARLLTSHPLNRHFWSIVLPTIGFMFTAWFAIDVYMDTYAWDRWDKNGYDVILAIFVCFGSAILGSFYFLFCSKK